MTPEWRVEPAPIDYPDAVATMEARAGAIRAGEAAELIWLLEHPPLYTAGTAADPAELLAAGGLPVFQTGRGGRHTYHGPGQRVVYVLLDLDARGRDVRRFVGALEAWIVDAMAALEVPAFAAAGRTGVWVNTAQGEAKIAAIGVRVRRWVTYHGFALNLDPDLKAFNGIVPCGLASPVTSVAALGRDPNSARADKALLGTLPAFLCALG